MLKLKSMMELKDAGNNQDESTPAPIPPIPEKIEHPVPFQQGCVDADKPSLQRQEWTGNEPPIRCPYRGKPRPVHPAVCEYHREMKDPECIKQKCPRVNLG